MTPLKPLLIEHWLPIQAIGAESQRERGASSALPPLYFLHVWWARRPLTTSRAAILASVLPQWSADLPPALLEKFPNEESYFLWFTRLIGIFGDPVAARKLIEYEKRTGIATAKNKYGYRRAFTVNPSADDLKILGDLLEWTWGKRNLSILDPFSGGGSIPFESNRYSFQTYANELNPVASVILKGTLDYPFRYGLNLSDDILKWGKKWQERAKSILDPYFATPEKLPKRNIYMWARTVACPVTGKIVPLSPNWWIKKEGEPVAARMICESTASEPKFEILKGKQINFDPELGTITRGIGRSPWTGETIDGDYIKAEAQAGRMGQFIYCVEVQTEYGREYVAPSQDDMKFARLAENALIEKRAEWISKNFIPTEPVPEGSKTSEPLRYGMDTWDKMFSPRQLFAMGTYVETLREIEVEVYKSSDKEKAKAIMTYLSFALDKCLNYNSRMSIWHPLRAVVANTFNRHDFAFAWSHAEYNSAEGFLLWALDQIVDAYRGIANLVAPLQKQLQPISTFTLPTIIQGSASNIVKLSDASIDNITVDPPYYDNVQYAELSDFFYVWLKRSIGHLYPEFFRDELTNKDDEAVANPARFVSMGKKKKELAEQDYENKMTAAFREMYRVLRPEGSLTVMFTHKKVEAWNTLASALINAGFVIKASWPVHTESEHSLHQAKKNAAASTILLVCRKRETVQLSGEATWWDDLAPRVREAARQKAEEFSAQGINGVDLYISTFGPALSIISEHWPVLTSEVDPKTGQPKPLRPETALDLAREEVVRLRKQGLLAGRDVRFDPVTDWYLMAWDAFHAEEFPYDEGRKLAIALGVDMDRLIMTSKRLAIKKSNSVVVQVPAKRNKEGMVDPDLVTFEHWIDAAHTTMLVYEEDGAGACDVFLRKANLKNDNTFKALLQSMINAIPRARIKGKFARPEAETLENIRLAFFPELTVPVEDEPQMPVEKQIGMFEEAVEVDEEESDEGEE